MQGYYTINFFRRSRPLGRRSRFSNSRSSPKCERDAPWVLTSSRKITGFKIKMAIFHFHVFGAPLWAVNELLHFQKCRFWHKSLALKKPLNQFEEKKLLVIFVCFWWIWFCDLTFTALNCVQNLSIYIGKVKGFWSIFGRFI